MSVCKTFFLLMSMVSMNWELSNSGQFLTVSNSVALHSYVKFFVSKKTEAHNVGALGLVESGTSHAR